jgi:decaprenylphospho-beta-D-ribofuranose 2-oxidase
MAADRQAVPRGREQANVKTRLRSFDGTEHCDSSLEAPDRYSTLFRALTGDRGHAVRGGGLSYCLAGAAAHGTTVSMEQFDRVLDFDADRRRVTVESGMTVGALNDFVVARGCYFPVLPGHPSITVGGCAGFNVHGKTQHNIGHFSDHVVALTLFHPDHGEVRCGDGGDRELLALTLGGMGLTGCILDVTLQLQPLAADAVRRTVHRVANLHEAVEVMRGLDADALYSWNDLNARGGRFGAGVVYEERFQPGDVRSTSRYRRLQARRRPTPRLWNAATVRMVNAVYPLRDLARPNRVKSVHDAAFPINGSEAYFAGFGFHGFHEYQMVVPHDAWTDAVGDLDRAIARSGTPVTLGSLKLFAGSPHLLWFRGDGVCVTIDVAAGPDARALFGVLDRLAIDYRAKVNIAKDSRLAASTVAAVYPEYDAFRTQLDAFDPKRRFDTPLRRRLDL